MLKRRQEGPDLESEILPEDSAAETLAGLLATLRRQSRLIGAACALGLAGGALFIAFAPKKYTATASVFVDFLHPTTLSTTQVITLNNGLVDPAAVESQIDILKSERLALRAIRRLELLKNPDLVRYQNPILWAPRYLAAALGLISSETDYEIERSVVEALMNNTTVERAGKSQQTFLIEVSYDAQDPELAARIANAIVTAYLTDQLEARFEMAKLANDWFNDRLREMRDSVVAAERTAQKFKADNDINTVIGNPVEEQNLSQSEQNLVTARATLADARARLDRLDQIIAAGNVEAVVPETLASPLIQRLRGDYADMARREADLRRRVAPDHNSVVQIRASIAQTQRLIMDEFERIRTSTENEVKIDQGRVAGLEQEKGSAVSSSTVTKAKMVQAAELDREATAVRALYESFMGRFQTTSQEQSYPVSEARLITEAKPPIKQSRRKALVLALGGAAGLLLGVGAAWLRENISMRIRTGQELEIATGVRFLGNLPALLVDPPAEVKSRQLQDEGRFRAIGRMLARALASFSRGRLEPLVRFLRPAATLDVETKYTTELPSPDYPEGQFALHDPILRYAVNEPLSLFAETMRSCKICLQQLPRQSAASVVGIASAMPKEGKSTFASNFAHHLASVGHRTLLIDGDLRNPALSDAYGARHSRGLLHILSERATLDDVAMSDPTTKLWFVPSGVQKAIANSAELLASPGFQGLIASARERFDYVVFDFPPLLSVVDGRVAAEHLNGLFIVAEWGRADPEVIRWALKQSPDLKERVIGCVLNKVPPQETDAYEGYY